MVVNIIKVGRTLVCLLAGSLFPSSWILHLASHIPLKREGRLDIL